MKSKFIDHHSLKDHLSSQGEPFNALSKHRFGEKEDSCSDSYESHNNLSEMINRVGTRRFDFDEEERQENTVDFVNYNMVSLNWN